MARIFWCLLLLCTAPITMARRNVRTGGRCSQDAECFSAYCYNGACATDGPIEGKVGTGGPCVRDQQCYTNRCVSNQCRAAIGGNGDSSSSPPQPSTCVIPTRDLISIPPKIMQDESCTTHFECYSGYCDGMTCAKDSCSKGKVGGGGNCQQDRDCFSGSCHLRKCATDSPVQGKIGSGGPCSTNGQCYSDECRDRNCV